MNVPLSSENCALTLVNKTLWIIVMIMAAEGVLNHCATPLASNQLTPEQVPSVYR